MTNALAINDNSIIRTYDEVERVAKAMAASGYFQDAKSISQAIVKIMAGSEIGFGPFASMQGVNIIKGNPSFNANMLASSVKASAKYDYRIIKLDDTICELMFYENGAESGKSVFTIQDAKKAGTSNLDKFPRNMLFARAMSNGVRWYCPDVTNGNAVYTPEELGAEVDEDGNIIDGTSVTIEEPVPTPTPTPRPAHNTDWIDEALDEAGPEAIDEPQYDFKTRPYPADTLKAALAIKADKLSSYKASDKQRGLLRMLLNEHFQDDTKRHEACEWLLGAGSTKEIPDAMVKVALDWLKPEKDDGGAYQIDATAKTELSGVLTVALEAAGQEALL